MSAQKEMPRYQCHKKVWALKIGSIVVVNCIAMLTPADAEYAPFEVPLDWVEKFRPHVGGYYVVYEDGYVSFSPAKPFEEGYTRI